MNASPRRTRGGGRSMLDVRARQQHVPFVRSQDADDNSNEGSLAGSIGTDQADKITFGDAERNPGNRLHAAETDRDVI